MSFFLHSCIILRTASKDDVRTQDAGTGRSKDTACDAGVAVALPATAHSRRSQGCRSSRVRSNRARWPECATASSITTSASTSTSCGMSSRIKFRSSEIACAGCLLRKTVVFLAPSRRENLDAAKRLSDQGNPDPGSRVASDEIDDPVSGRDSFDPAVQVLLPSFLHHPVCSDEG